MTNVLDPFDIKKEIAYRIRNADIFTTTQRGVTTTTDTGTFSSDTDHLINVTNVKNIRTIVVDGDTLVYGTDYDYSIDFNDSNIIKTKITFTAAQTGDYTITYDYGTDKIFPDFPRSDLTINSFPRIGFDIINMSSSSGGHGNVNLTDVNITIIVYGTNTDDIDDWITTIRTWIIENQKTFYYLFIVRPTLIGPILKYQEEGNTRDKIFQKNIDMIGEWNYEIN